MSSTLLKMRPSPSTEPGPGVETPDHVARVRDALAATHVRIESRWPRVLDVHAQVVAARATELRGHTSQLRGCHEDTHFRAMARGERGWPDVDVTRLVVMAPDVGLRAIQAGDRALYAAVGLTVSWAPILARETAVEATAGFIESSSRLSAAIMRDLEDGQVDSAGAHLDALARVKREIAELEAALLPLVQERARPVRKGDAE